MFPIFGFPLFSSTLTRLLPVRKARRSLQERNRIRAACPPAQLVALLDQILLRAQRILTLQDNDKIIANRISGAGYDPIFPGRFAVDADPSFTNRAKVHAHK